MSLLPEEPPRLLRRGMVDRSAIERVLGQHVRHYAPNTPAWRFDVPEDAARRNHRLGWLLCGSGLEVSGTVLNLGRDPDAYARRLYAAPYRLDHANLNAILVEIPSDEERWSAVRDQITRATRPYDPQLVNP